MNKDKHSFETTLYRTCKEPKPIEDFDKGLIGWLYRYKEKNKEGGLTFDLFIPINKKPKKSFKATFVWEECPYD